MNVHFDVRPCQAPTRSTHYCEGNSPEETHLFLLSDILRYHYIRIPGTDLTTTRCGAIAETGPSATPDALSGISGSGTAAAAAA
jgi:hypothetical protein